MLRVMPHPSSKSTRNDDTRANIPGTNGEQDTSLPDKTQTCGYLSCHPRWLQKCLNPKVFVAVICCFGFIQGYVVNGVNNANTASYEKRFLLSSSRVGAISSSYDFTAAIFAIPISYFGAHVHKPRMLGIMAIVFGIGSFIMLLPHITTSVYYYGQENPNMCTDGQKGDGANPDDKKLPDYLYVLCLGMALMGIGGTALYTVGTAAVDESVTRQAASFALGLFYAMAALGPALGFLLNATFLGIFVDADVAPTPDFDDDDARWVGAWWMGFVIPTGLFIILALVLLTFPRVIPVSQKVVQSRIDQSQEGLAEEVTRPGFGNNIWDLPRATLNLLKNLPFLFVSLAGVSDGIVSSGLGTFTAKFVEQQFNKSVAFSNLVLGAILVTGAVSGQLVGGYVCKRFKLKVRGMLRYCVVGSVVMAILTSAFWLRCDDAHIAGVNRQYENGMVVLAKANLTAECNSACHCSDRIHEPVCGADKLEYLNPCYAGCYNLDTETKTYTNCSCIDESLGNGTTTASIGRCDKSCVLFYVAVVLYFFMMFTMFMDWAPRSTITLRCVPETQRTYALGLQWVFVRLLGTVPGPIMLGAVVDLTCKYYRESSDQSAFACLVYDRYLLSRNIFLLSFFVKLNTALMYALALLFYKPPKLASTSGEVDGTEIARHTSNNYPVGVDTGYDADFVALAPDASLGVSNKAFVDVSEPQNTPKTLINTEL